jgi:large subunit ribosomal protein L19
LSKDLSWLVGTKPNPNIPSVRAGDRVKVSLKTKEGDKERTQLFQGVVIRTRKGGNTASLTVRQVSHGIGVERTFFLNSPYLEKLEVVQHSDVRRARLYYIRGLSSKASRAKLRSKARMEQEAVLETPAEAESSEEPAEEEVVEEEQAEEQQ